MEKILNFDPIIETLSSKLNNKDLKSLSEVSKGWWNSTSQIFTERFVLKVTDSSVKLQRKYKHIKIKGDDLEHKLSTISSEVEHLNIYQSRLTSFKTLAKFKSLKSLLFLQSEIPFECTEDEFLIRDLESFQTTMGGKNIPALQQFLKANISLKRLVLSLTNRTYDFEPYNIFLKSIYLPKLEVFMLRTSSIICNEGLIEFFKSHNKVKYSSITNSRISDEVVKTLIQNSRNIETLILEVCLKLTNSIAREIKELTCLKRLILNNLYIDLEKLCNIEQLQHFKFINSRSESWLTQSKLENFLTFSTNLKTLDLSNPQKCQEHPLSTYFALSLVASRMPNIVELRLDRVFDDNEDGKKYIKKITFEKLKILSLSCSKLTDNLLSAIYAPKLETFEIAQSKVKDSGLIDLANNSAFLAKVDLSQSSDLEFSTVIYLFEKLQFLKNINVFECAKFCVDDFRKYFEREFYSQVETDRNELKIVKGSREIKIFFSY